MAWKKDFETLGDAPLQIEFRMDEAKLYGFEVTAS
jgi:hypothetical protein